MSTLGASLMWTHFASVAFAAPTIEVLGHDHAVVGEEIRLRIRVSNPDVTPIQFPDINNRPWLVRFDTVDTAGVRRQLFSTPPADDLGAQWTLNQGQRRESLFSVPSSAEWGEGVATIKISIEDQAITSRRITLFSLKADHEDTNAAPVDQQVGHRPRLLTRYTGNTSEIWLQAGGHTAFLTRTPGHIQPELSVTRADRPIGRWLSWTAPDGRLWALRTQDRGRQAQPTEIRLPWPSARHCGRPATDADAQLVQPVCIPGPDGQSSHLMAAIVTNTGATHTRPISRFRPDQVLTHVDSAGHVNFVLVRKHAIDLATLGTERDNRRPARIRRMWRAAPGQTLASAKIIMATNTPAEPAVALVFEDGSAPITVPIGVNKH